MGKRKDQDTVFAARIRQLPAGLYPLLLARATDPFSDADTNPFRTSGHAGDRYIYIRYCPDRNTKTPLGSPEFVQGVVRQILVESPTPVDTPAHAFSKASPPKTHKANMTIVEHEVGASSDPDDLPQTLSAAIADYAQMAQPAIIVADDLPRCLEAMAVDVDPPVPSQTPAANIVEDQEARRASDLGPTDQGSPAPHKENLGNPAHRSNSLQIPKRVLGQLSNSYWKLPSASTIGMAAALIVAGYLAPDTINGPATAPDAQLNDLPQMVPSKGTATNAVPVGATLKSSEQTDLPQQTKVKNLPPARHGKLANLFAALSQVNARNTSIGATKSTFPVSIRTDETPACGELLEQALLGVGSSVNSQENAIRQVLRTDIATAEFRDGALLLAVRDTAAYRQAISDIKDPSRSLSGLGIGSLWLAFEGDHIVVVEVSP